eukprot:9948151-Lingulodinium_polyedra.AAC.1
MARRGLARPAVFTMLATGVYIHPSVFAQMPALSVAPAASPLGVGHQFTTPLILPKEFGAPTNAG